MSTQRTQMVAEIGRQAACVAHDGDPREEKQSEESVIDNLRLRVAEETRERDAA